MNQISLYNGSLPYDFTPLISNVTEGKAVYITHLIVHNTTSSPIKVMFSAAACNIIEREIAAKDTWFIELPKLGITLHTGDHFHGKADIASVVNIRAFGFEKTL